MPSNKVLILYYYNVLQTVQVYTGLCKDKIANTYSNYHDPCQIVDFQFPPHSKRPL